MLRSLVTGFLSSPAIEEVSESFVPQAIGYSSSMTALVLACAGAVLRVASRACRRKGSTHGHLLPTIGAPYHAMALLELGDWKTVSAGIAAGELESTFRRHIDTGVIEYVRGRTLAAASASPEARTAAIAALSECLHRAETNGLSWWRAAALLEIGKIHLSSNAPDAGRNALTEALELADERGFGLLKIDARLALAEDRLQSGDLQSTCELLDRVATDMESCGYGLRDKALAKLRKAAVERNQH